MKLTNRKAQHGAAAMEFALCLPVFMILAWGLLSFGALFYTQLAVARAAHDGANAIAMLPADTVFAELEGESETEGESTPESPLEVIRDLVQASLAATPIVPGIVSLQGRREWLSGREDLRITVNDTSEDCGSPCVTLRVEYPYGNGVRLLPTISLPGLGVLSFIPDQLTAQAVVAR